MQSKLPKLFHGHVHSMIYTTKSRQRNNYIIKTYEPFWYMKTKANFHLFVVAQRKNA